MNLLISDIHSNIYAFEKVLNFVQSRSIGKVYCLGDVIGYGDYPNECVELLISLNPVCVKGNHEVFFFGNLESSIYNTATTREILTEQNAVFLRNLDEFAEDKLHNAVFSHTFPVGTANYVYPNSDFSVFDKSGYKYFFAGHTHRPSYFTYFDKKIINPGSVGQPRDGDPRPSIVLFDLESDYFEFVRVS